MNKALTEIIHHTEGDFGRGRWDSLVSDGSDRLQSPIEAADVRTDILDLDHPVVGPLVGPNTAEGGHGEVETGGDVDHEQQVYHCLRNSEQVWVRQKLFTLVHKVEIASDSQETVRSHELPPSVVPVHQTVHQVKRNDGRHLENMIG